MIPLVGTEQESQNIIQVVSVKLYMMILLKLWFLKLFIYKLSNA